MRWTICGALALALLGPAGAVPAAGGQAEDRQAIVATALDYLEGYVARFDGRWVIVNVLWERKPRPETAAK